jgi:hypothetical protein
MSLLVSDMGFLLDQNIALALAAVPWDRLDFIGPSLNTSNYAYSGGRNGTVRANVKRRWNCADKSRRCGAREWAAELVMLLKSHDLLTDAVPPSW